MTTRTTRAVASIVLSFGCLLANFGTTPEARSNPVLQSLGSFETLNSLGFTPDDVAFSPLGARLLLAASADSGVGAHGVFEVTLDGRLVDAFPLPVLTTGLLGFSIDRVSSGPKVNHFFLAEFNGTPQIRVFEFDAAFNLLGDFPLTGSVWPGDGLVYNHLTQRLAILDAGFSAIMPGFAQLTEVSTDGAVVGAFPVPNIWGITFNEQTGSYFGTIGTTMVEFSTSGAPIATYDLAPFGVGNAVGITAGQGKLFIADEGNPPNSAGAVHILRLHGR